MPRAKTLLALLAAAATAATVLAVAACDDRNVYVYSGARFDPANACLEDYSPLETLPGEGASARCSPRCVAFEGALYVSTVCPPLPLGAELVEADAGACIAALRALTNDASCGAVTSPSPEAASPAFDAAATPSDDAGSGDAGGIRDAGPG